CYDDGTGRKCRKLCDNTNNCSTAIGGNTHCQTISGLGGMGYCNAGAARKRIFVTRTVTDGTFGSLTAGDGKCQVAADAVSIGGTWKAWLSDDSTDAFSRMANVGPWYLMDGTTQVFADRASMQS